MGFCLLCVLSAGCGSGDIEDPRSSTMQSTQGNAQTGVCGTPENPCGPAPVCSGGVCTCGTGLTLCGDRCVDLASDAASCGQCGVVCGGGSACSAGQCVCPATTTMCNGLCAQLQEDPMRCGACDRACAFGEICDVGQCMPAASDTCVETCGGGRSCVAGACVCPAGTFCGDACVDTATSAPHCGTCGNACPVGQTCVAGACACPAGQIACDAGCVDTQTSLTDCGGCGQPCADGETCMAGACRGAVGADGCSGLARGLSIDEIALYQSLKISVMQMQAEVVPDDRDADVVAGRDTLVRVFVHPETGFTSRELSARVTLVNGTTEDQYFAKQVISGDSSDESTASTFMIYVPPEKIAVDTRYSVEVVECGADPGTGSMVAPRFPASGDADLGVRETGVLKIAIVPVLCNSLLPDTSDTALAVYRDYLRAMYPVSDVEISVTAQISTSYPVNWNNLLEQVRNKRQTDAPASDVYYYGFVKPAASMRDYCRSSCTAGVGYVGSSSQSGTRAAVGVAFADQASAGAMAHEVGHNHGRNHAPCAPGGGISGVDPSYPYSGATLGTWGFDFRSRVLFDPSETTDIMGYCNMKWVSDYTYRGLTDRVATLNGNFARFFAEGALSTYRVMLIDEHGPRWSFPITEPIEAYGEPELADVLDASGSLLTQITVYRTEIGDSRGLTVLVPEPELGWHAVRVLGYAPLALEP